MNNKERPAQEPEGGAVQRVFREEGEFAAARAAEAWCAARGISVGHSQRGSPRGLLVGDFDIAKWRNLSWLEQDGLDGTMSGDMRNGPVYVDIDFAKAERRAVRAAACLKT